LRVDRAAGPEAEQTQVIPMRILSIILMLAAAAAAAPAAVAGQPAGRAASNDLRIAQEDGPSLSEAVEMVRRKYQGRIVSAETRVSGNREVHIIRVMTNDGKVITERIPGRTVRGG
jgi:hypothetical protein